MLRFHQEERKTVVDFGRLAENARITRLAFLLGRATCNAYISTKILVHTRIFGVLVAR